MGAGIKTDSGKKKMIDCVDRKSLDAQLKNVGCGKFKTATVISAKSVEEKK